MVAHLLGVPLLLRLSRRQVGGPGSAPGNPVSQGLDFAFLKRAAQRHAEHFAANRAQDEAFVGLSRNERRSALAARQELLARVGAQPAKLLFLPVAGVALLGQQRPDRCFEELEIDGARFLRRRSGRADANK